MVKFRRKYYHYKCQVSKGTLYMGSSTSSEKLYTMKRLVETKEELLLLATLYNKQVPCCLFFLQSQDAYESKIVSIKKSNEKYDELLGLVDSNTSVFYLKERSEKEFEIEHANYQAVKIVVQQVIRCNGYNSLLLKNGINGIYNDVYCRKEFINHPGLYTVRWYVKYDAIIVT